jgi:hypothetical protein
LLDMNRKPARFNLAAMAEDQRASGTSKLPMGWMGQAADLAS